MIATQLRQGLRIISRTNKREGRILWVGKNTSLVSFQYDPKPGQKSNSQTMSVAKFLASFEEVAS